MLFSTVGQIHVFLYMLGAGLVIGAVYALLSGLRRLMEAGFWLSLAVDALFGLVCACILIAAMLKASYASVRLYELLGALSGALLFRAGVQPVLEALLRKITHMLRNLIKKCANFRPFKVIFR